MRNKMKIIGLTLLFGLNCSLTFGQVQMPTAPQATRFQQYGNNGLQNPNTVVSVPNPMDIFNGTSDQQRIQKQNQMLIQEVEQNEKLRTEQLNQVNKDIAEYNSNRINYSLPSYGNIESTKYYRNAFDKLNGLNPNDFSVEKATFLIENAYFEEKQNYEDFNKLIIQIGDFLREKMEALGYDQKSNLAKNFMLFKFFSDTLEIESKNLKHLPFKYDFEDYMGIEDWSKMFVSKLLTTAKGQCNSLPRLYLILAEEIGAEAFLSLAPNHSYIRFRDDYDNWYNVELTNGMFTTQTFILQSGYIKSEALQNEIFMQKMSSKQLLSQLLADFAMGYTRKFGYDSFVKEVIDKSLLLDPNSISANMLNSNYLTIKFEYVAKQANINPRNNQELQNIRYFPKMVELLNQVNSQYSQIDNLGYEFMPPKAYEEWLNSLKDEKQKQDSKDLENQFNIKVKQPIKN